MPHPQASATPLPATIHHRPLLLPVAAAALVALAGFGAAHAATVTVSGPVSPTDITLAPGDTLVITPTGFVDAGPTTSGTRVDFSRNTVENAGRIRVFFGSESNGLVFGGPGNRNLGTGSIEAGAFELRDGQLLNEGLITSGAVTSPDGVLRNYGDEGAGTFIGGTARLESSGTLRSYARFDVFGSLENSGTLEQRFFTAHVPGTVGSYNPVMKVGSFLDGLSSRFDNVGSATFDGGTKLLVEAIDAPSAVNTAIVQNNGQMVFKPGAVLELKQLGRFVNGTGGVVDIGGAAPLLPGEVAATAFMRGVYGYVNGPGARTIVRGSASMVGGVDNAGDFVISGSLLNEGKIFHNQGVLEVDGLLFRGYVENTGRVRVLNNGVVEVDELLVSDGGQLVVDAGGQFVGVLGAQGANGIDIAGRAVIKGGTLGPSGFTPPPPFEVMRIRAGAEVLLDGDAQLELLPHATGSSEGSLVLVNASRLLVGSSFTNRGSMVVGGTLDLRPSMSEGQLFNEAGATLEVEGRIVGAAAVPGETGGIIVNNGSLRIGIAGVIGPADNGPLGAFFQEGGELAIDAGGELNTRRLTMSGGVLWGNGRINGEVFIEGGGPVDPSVSCLFPERGVACFKPGYSPGRMEIGGALTMGQGSVLELELTFVDGTLAWDSVAAESMSFVDGALIRLIVDAGVSVSEPLQLLSCVIGTCDFAGAQFQLVGSATASWLPTASGLSVVVATPIPEPGAAAMLALGLVVLGWRRRAALRHREAG